MNALSGSPEAIEDFKTVQQAVASPHIKELQAIILDGTATEDEIVEHYRTFDAIGSQTVFKNEKAAFLQIRSMGHVALADFIGGSQMISSAILGGLIKDNDGFAGILDNVIDENNLALIQQQWATGKIDNRDLSNWNAIAEYGHTGSDGPLTHLAERVGLLHYVRLSGILGANVIANTTDTLKSVSLGKAIMGEGSIGFRHYIDLQRAPLLRTDKDVAIANTLVEVAESPDLQMDLSDLVLRSGSLIDTVEAKDMVLNEMKDRFGPMLSWPTASNSLHTDRFQGTYYKLDVSGFREMQEASFRDALHNLRILANYARETDPKMFQKGRIKGSLHEVLWILDAYAVRKGDPDRLGTWTVDAATEAEDYPFVGGPAMKRGFDFVIKPELGSTTRRLIQVGASRKKTKNKTELAYHPDIEVYCEKEFNEVNLSTLDNKLDAYLRWADSGFAAEDYARLRINQRLLGTVKECFGRAQGLAR